MAISFVPSPDGGPVKIGTSINVEARISQLEAFIRLAVINAADEFERRAGK